MTAQHSSSRAQACCIAWLPPRLPAPLPQRLPTCVPPHRLLPCPPTRRRAVLSLLLRVGAGAFVGDPKTFAKVPKRGSEYADIEASRTALLGVCCRRVLPACCCRVVLLLLPVGERREGQLAGPKLPMPGGPQRPLLPSLLPSPLPPPIPAGLPGAPAALGVRRVRGVARGGRAALGGGAARRQRAQRAAAVPRDRARVGECSERALPLLPASCLHGGLPQRCRRRTRAPLVSPCLPPAVCPLFATACVWCPQFASLDADSARAALEDLAASYRKGQTARHVLLLEAQPPRSAAPQVGAAGVVERLPSSACCCLLGCNACRLTASATPPPLSPTHAGRAPAAGLLCPDGAPRPGR